MIKDGLKPPITKKSNDDDGIERPLISIGLAVALAYSILPKKHEKAKIVTSEIVTIIWLIYSIYHKDYLVMVICVAILLYILGQSSKEQVKAWP